MRAIAFARSGQFELALEDNNKAIALKPGAPSFGSRATTYEQEGRYDLALPDLQTALSLAPNSAGYKLETGIAQWATGHPDDAAGSFTDAMNLRPNYAYNWIWLAIADAAQGKAANAFNRASSSDDQKKWPGPIVEFFAGKIAEKDVFAFAATGDEESQKGQKCEADFYVGEWQLLHRSQSEVKQLLDDAQQICPRDFIELRAANFELARLSASVKS